MDLGEFFGGVETVDLLLVLYFGAFFVLGFAQGTIRRHGGALLRSTRLFDIYRGRPLADAEKSLAYRLAFQADDRTLVESEVDTALGAITAGLAADVGGRLRT